ncbi:hypothetical protein KKC1_18060 [Calderihabitans maritimus]|uniref:Uncharacterized protein n=1 Tax=Calderihabitans maritimus TaxID=1246530 RepID=A0A1Z5HTL2_9FIRM|nr:hypothetical protein KKC1_18060 [Calderihabitans maritimus]
MKLLENEPEVAEKLIEFSGTRPEVRSVCGVDKDKPAGHMYSSPAQFEETG